jgi:hypothetical protein
MLICEAKQILKENGYKVKSLAKLKNEIYRAVEPYTKNMTKWDNFSKIIDIQEAIRDVVGPDLMCDIDGGNSTRLNKDGLEYREFDISIYENKNDYEMILVGKLVCNSAGTMDDPWKLYDITVLL